MGVLTGLYYVDYGKFDQMVFEDQLDQLIAVLNGYKEPAEIGFPEGHTFERCSLDKSWDDFSYALRGIDGQGMFHALKQHLQTIDHDWAYAFFWWPEALIEGLSDFRTRLTAKTGLDLPGCPWDSDPKLQIIPPSRIEEAMTTLKEKVMAQLDAGESWDDWSGEAFTEWYLDYVLSYFGKTVVFLTNSLTFTEDEAAVKAVGQVVVGISS